MTYNIETLSQSKLLRLLISIHDKYCIEAIDAKSINNEINRIETLERQKQIVKDIANSGFGHEELLEVLTNMVENKLETIPKAPSSNSNTLRQKTMEEDNIDVQEIVENNLRHERDAFDKKLKALMDKYNTSH